MLAPQPETQSVETAENPSPVTVRETLRALRKDGRVGDVARTPAFQVYRTGLGGDEAYRPPGTARVFSKACLITAPASASAKTIFVPIMINGENTMRPLGWSKTPSAVPALPSHLREGGLRMRPEGAMTPVAKRMTAEQRAERATMQQLAAFEFAPK